MKFRNFFQRGMTVACITLGLFFVTQLFAADVPRMSKEELQPMLGNPDVIIIDVRAGGDWAGSDSKIKGAVREDPAQIDSWINKYPKDKTIIFY